MAELRRVRADAPLEDVLRVLSEDGGVIVEQLIDARTVAAINREVDGWVEAADPAMRHLNPAIQIFFGDRTKHVGGIAGKSRTFATEVMIHPLLLGLCDAILGPSCACYQLNLAHLIARGPGAEHQYLHRDELVWNMVPRPHRPNSSTVGNVPTKQGGAELLAVRKADLVRLVRHVRV